jgi:glycosyltransferase involved in cell wall biosynthesis
MSRAPLTSLHLTNAWHPTSGGVRVVYRALLDFANNTGRPVRLVVPGPRADVEDVGSFGRIYTVAAPRAFAVDRRYRLIMPTRYLLPFVQGVRQILRAEQPDIVDVCDKHSLPYIGGLLKKGWVSGVPRPTLVATSAERFDDAVRLFLGDRPATRTFATWFMRRIYAPMFDYHVANSEYTAEELRTALPAHRQHAVHVSPPALAADAFRSFERGNTRQALLDMAGGRADSKLLVYVGRLSREKHLGLLVDMLAHLHADAACGGPDVRLLVAGDGPERSMLDAARARLGGRLHLLGNLPGGAAVRRLLCSADAFVHPNPREPFGLAPLEAMAVGLPLVAPDRGGILTYADEDTAWLASPSGRALADAVRALLRDAPEASRRAAAGRARAIRFHEARAVPAFFDLLDALHRERLANQAGRVVPMTAGPATQRAAATSR